MDVGKLKEALPYYEKVMEKLTFKVIWCLKLFELLVYLE